MPSVPGASETVYECGWEAGDKFRLTVYVSPEPPPQLLRPEHLVWEEHGLTFGSLKEKTKDLVIVPKGGVSPARMCAHIYLVKEGAAEGDPLALIYRKQPLGGTDGDKGDWFYPHLDISLVDDPSAYDLASLHPFTVQRMSADGKRYTPIVYMNDFWHLKDRRIHLKGDEPSVKLVMTLSPLSLYKYQMLLTFDHSFKINAALFDDKSTNGGGMGSIDSIKESLMTTRPWILFLTLIVTILHTLFDFLAFKNDIQFWRKQEDLTGLSVRTILINSVFQLIILLYLFEQNTSFIVLASTAIGLLIEVWKVFRVVKIEVKTSRFGIPYPTFKDRSSYEAKTKEYDDIAIKYLSILAIPLLIGYSIYSLLYERHPTYYSWLLGSLVGFVYAFGFIMMTPQLFINYKLKSVAHLPWRVFIYKSLNTFIDDLFAFIIKMPLLHRLACFRDDLVFLVALYQRWIYPVDKTRANEYGQVFEKEDGEAKDTVEKTLAARSTRTKRIKAE